mgnify:CR=1 FL=1
MARDDGTRARLLAMFEAQGVAASRVAFAPWQLYTKAHLETYHQVDIALDSFPYNGTTTTCEALWMGVPVITLYGTRHAGRMVSSVLNSAGLANWIAQSPEQYINIAQQLASNLPNLVDLRTKLRGHLAASPLCDGPRFAAGFARVLRQLFEQRLAAG